eukprot:6439933-Pyramimonas_sp.AAC.1
MANHAIRAACVDSVLPRFFAELANLSGFALLSSATGTSCAWLVGGAGRSPPEKNGGPFTASSLVAGGA